MNIADNPRIDTMQAIERALGLDKIKKDLVIQDEVELHDYEARKAQYLEID